MAISPKILHFCMAIPQRVYEMRTKLVAFFEHCLTKLWLMQKKFAKEEKGKDSHDFGIENAAGEKEMPIVIGKSASPQYCKGISD